jgi:hypothetical protein
MPLLPSCFRFRHNGQNYDNFVTRRETKGGKYPPRMDKKMEKAGGP